ncbi:ATP-dependent helicase [Herbaspirillum sp. SJZ107]|uniref:ATP-dependent helicase n=1 Tax=Herbaspirillum sp. SJZ107 TaxID=2572881 RepID=UPI00115156D3|nr:ATP-dependent helicase [Herbaspirillum sp. SJZ107]TQK03226.1 DNA helicase-2/ATP-dependent DNA helicase PcrA [Herbaspirillum sp. SJZ107]
MTAAHATAAFASIPASATADADPAVPDPFGSLNPAQREAVEHGIGAALPQPLLVVAGAGSGKTNTLAHRVARLIQSGADPQRILLLTFSRRAANEMGQRAAAVLQRLFGSAGAPGLMARLPWAGTFHSIGARLLREYAGNIGLEASFTINDRGDSEDLMGMVRQEIGLGQSGGQGGQKRFPLKGTCLSIYSRVVNSREPLDAVLQSTFPWCAEWEAQLKRLFGAYVDAKQAQNVLDYDDLLLFWAEMAADPELGPAIGAQFDHVLVDEYQDTNRLQAAILHGMKPDGAGVMVVGDDAQAIYSFRGATVRNIMEFPQQFSQPARIVTLDRNYRSTQPILDASNAVIAAAVERHAKTLWTDKTGSGKPQLVLIPDEAEQARWVCNRVLEQREAGIKLTQQAVLFRAASHSAALELELVRRNIPFVKFGGLKFLEAAHIKDLLAVLRFVQNPSGRLAGFRVVQLIPGIGPATAARCMDAVAEAAEPAAALAGFAVPARARDDWDAFVALFAALRTPGLRWPMEIELVRNWYQPHLERQYDDAAVRAADLEQLVALAGGYGSRESFLTELTLDPPEATSDRAGAPLLDEDYLILSTIHSSKGQEWKSVTLLNVVDGCIPSDMATGSLEDIEEERRLLYVAMTRAKENLQLVVPNRFFIKQQAQLGDRHVYAQRTRFISPAMLKHFEEAVWNDAETLHSRKPVPDAVRMLVRERARNAWK